MSCKKPYSNTCQSRSLYLDQQMYFPQAGILALTRVDDHSTCTRSLGRHHGLCQQITSPIRCADRFALSTLTGYYFCAFTLFIIIYYACFTATITFFARSGIRCLSNMLDNWMSFDNFGLSLINCKSVWSWCWFASVLIYSTMYKCLLLIS